MAPFGRKTNVPFRLENSSGMTYETFLSVLIRKFSKMFSVKNAIEKFLSQI